MITIAIDPAVQEASFALPDGLHTIKRIPEPGGRPTYALTRPDGRVSTAHDFGAACAYLLRQGLVADRPGRAVRS